MPAVVRVQLVNVIVVVWLLFGCVPTNREFGKTATSVSPEKHKPILLLKAYTINDSNTGRGKGNGNGIPESGEVIEFTPIIQNTGDSTDIELSVSSNTAGIKIESANEIYKKTMPGESRVGPVILSVAPTFLERNIALRLRIKGNGQVTVYSIQLKANPSRPLF